MIDELLAQFSSTADTGPLGIPHSHYHAGSGAHNRHTVIGCLIHGNEYGTLPAALDLVRDLRSGALRTSGPVTVLLGNVDAARQDVRFVEEDFNRVFTFDRPAESLERRRAEHVRPLLDRADYFLDIHQTQTPTEHAFFTFPWTLGLGDWARALGAAEVGLTRAATATFSPGRRCLDEYVRDRGKVGFTLEIGQRGFEECQNRRASHAMRRFIELVDAVEMGASIGDFAATCSPIRWYQTAHVERAVQPGTQLRPGLNCWTAVRQGEVLSAEGSPVLRAPQAGHVLFPKYPAPGTPAPPELYRLATQVENPAALS